MFTTSDSLQVPKVECSGVLQGHSKLRKNSRAIFWNVKSARQFVHFISFAEAQCAELSLVKQCADWYRLARGVKAQYACASRLSLHPASTSCRSTQQGSDSLQQVYYAILRPRTEFSSDLCHGRLLFGTFSTPFQKGRHSFIPAHADEHMIFRHLAYPAHYHPTRIT